MKLWRAHGLGNDYLVLEEGPPMSAALAQAVCDRHLGVGGDGVLEPADPGRCDYGVRIWNPDGSVAEKSGNGLRIFARWLHEERGAETHFSVWTGSDAVRCSIGERTITVHMGRATVQPNRVPVISEHPVVDERWIIAGQPLTMTVVGLGNPHAIAFVEDDELDALPWRAWGQALETDPRFPNRTNVQIARCTPDHIEIRIWERGAGPTLASGSSSCAVVVAAIVSGRVKPGRHLVRMPGGDLIVSVSAALEVRLEGPIEPVGRICVDPRWLAAR